MIEKSGGCVCVGGRRKRGSAENDEEVNSLARTKKKKTRKRVFLIPFSSYSLLSPNRASITSARNP